MSAGRHACDSAVDHFDHLDRTVCRRHISTIHHSSRPSGCSSVKLLDHRTTSAGQAQASTMAAADQRDIYDSMTMQSDSETYDQPDISSPSSPSSDSASPLILYSPPTFWGLVRGAAINLLLPFVNGLMLGFGELFANELAFRFGWSNTKVRRAVRVIMEVVTDIEPGLPHPQTSRTRRRDANRSCREEKTQRPRAGCLHELGIGMRYKRFTHHICLGFASQHGEALALFGHFPFLLRHFLCVFISVTSAFDILNYLPEWELVNMSE